MDDVTICGRYKLEHARSLKIRLLGYHIEYKIIKTNPDRPKFPIPQDNN